jgi:uncharacterized protein (TIGR00369 family)
MAESHRAQIDLYQLTEGLAPGDFIDVPDAFAQQVPADCLLSAHGITLTRVGRGAAVAEMTVKAIDLNQRGIAQAGAIVALADATAGWASYSALEHGRFTTVNLTTNLLSAAREGDLLRATVTPVRLGRKVQVLEVTVEALRPFNGSGPAKAIAKFGCTQLVVEPAAGQANT